jgi:hypothetical protein
MKLPRQQIILTFAFALALVGFTSGFTRIQAQPAKPVVSTLRFTPPPPPNRGTPTGRSRGGASRGECPEVSKPLTALVPATQKTLGEKQAENPASTALEYVWGLTVAESPTLWFYVPYSLTAKLDIEFVLQDDKHNYVYKTRFAASQTQPGIVKLRLPSTVAPLEVGKMYHWYFIIDCNQNAPPLVEGWVQRVAPPPTLASQLQKATPRERIALYAANGIWHDALTSLAELRSANPQDAMLTADWVSLLQSVGLDAIAHEPMSQCCTLEK